MRFCYIPYSKVLFTYLFVVHVSVYGSIDDYYPQDLGPSPSNYGETGLLEMPSARLMEEGAFNFGISSSYPYEFTYMVASPFSWLEATYRYTEIKNQKYGPSSYSGNQTAKDKGFDIKIKLLEESYYAPQVAMGIRDLAGTGVFSGEYLVGSKQIRDFDLSLGIGWGVLGRSANINNPFINLDENFRNRTSQTGEGGGLNNDDWFSGRKAAIFGGVEYHLKKYGLSFKLEYDTTELDKKLFGQDTPIKSRYNFGIVRPFGKWVNLGLSYERGSELRFSFTFRGNYSDNLVPKLDPPKNVARLSRQQQLVVLKDKQVFYRSLNKGLREEAIFIQGATLSEDSVEIVIAQNRFRSYPRALGRAARIASALSPEEVKELNVVIMNGDLEVGSFNIGRDEFDLLATNRSSASEVYAKTNINSLEGRNSTISNADFKPIIKFPEIFWNMTPALRHQIGGPEAFYLGQLWWKINSTVKFKRGLSLHTVLGLDIYNTFDEFANPSYSSIPHVRSDIQEYLSEGKNNIARMKLDYIWSPKKDIFARIDVGYLEEMFGGLGGELYFRPFNRNFSAGISFHKVKQRNYDQRFGFRDYSTETGHLGFYYDFPKGVQSQLLVGKYLAGDKGATLDISRRFSSGFTLGVFATKTNLSSLEFGEGSFDKGFYFAIPLDLFYTNYQSGSISFGMHPLTKDGGATLNHHNSLYGLLGDTNKNSLTRDWKDILD